MTNKLNMILNIFKFYATYTSDIWLNLRLPEKKGGSCFPPCGITGSGSVLFDFRGKYTFLNPNQNMCVCLLKNCEKESDARTAKQAAHALSLFFEFATTGEQHVYTSRLRRQRDISPFRIATAAAVLGQSLLYMNQQASYNEWRCLEKIRGLLMDQIMDNLAAEIQRRRHFQKKPQAYHWAQSLGFPGKQVLDECRRIQS